MGSNKPNHSLVFIKLYTYEVDVDIVLLFGRCNQFDSEVWTEIYHK